MKLAVVTAVFGTVLLAEVGCMARTAALAEQFAAPAAVCLGTLLANLLLLLPVLFGAGWLHRHLPAHSLRLGAGVILIGMGLSLLFSRATP